MPLSSVHAPPRLLVVDDEEGLLFLLVDALRREGYEVEGRDSGDQALEWLRGNPADLLLLDLNLHDMPAPALIERLRKQGREFPFVVITGHGDERTAVQVMKQGALDYVMKDAGLLELLPAIVRRALTVVERERRLAEANEAIRQREQRHRKIIQTALDGFVRFDRAGRLQEVNQALCELLGYTAEELLSMTAADLENPGPGSEWTDWIAAPKADAVRFLVQLRRRDGAVLDAELSLRHEGSEIFGFVHDVSEQRRLEREVLEISEDERRRIGRDLHDGLGQQLTALEFMSQALARKLKPVDAGLTALAEEIAGYTRQAVQHTRQLAHGLAPVAIEAEGLMAALSDLAQITSRAGVLCSFECPAPVTLHDAAAAMHLYRIAQEAVQNALKHAGAAEIQIRLQDRGDLVELSVEDDGKGLAEDPPRTSGMGLQVIRYRARLIGGRVEIESAPEAGVRLVCSIPKSS